MATGVPAIDALFAAGRGLVAIPEAVRQEGVQGVAKGFLNPKPYEQASQARRIRSDYDDQIQSLEAALDAANDENDIAPLTGMFYGLAGQLRASGTANNDEALDSILGPLERKYRLAVRRIGLLPSMGDADEGGRAESLVRIGAMTGDPELSKAGNSLSSIFRSRALNEQAQALMGMRQADAPGKRELTEAQIRLAEARAGAADATARTRGVPTNSDVDRADRDLLRTVTNPITGDIDVDMVPPGHLLQKANERREANELSPLQHVPGRGLVEKWTLQDELQTDVRGGGSNTATGAGQFSGYGAGGAVPQAEDGRAPEAAPPMPQQQQAAPEPVISGRALVQQLVAQGVPLEEAKRRVRAQIAAQNGGAGANR